MVTLRFNKMQGLGNDFVVLDGVRQSLALSRDLVRRIAERRFGVGCDQLLVVEGSDQPGIDFRCQIYNADGSQVEQCGNGVRCVARFLLEQEFTKKAEIVLGTLGGIVRLYPLALDRIRVDMGVPELEPENIPFLGEGRVPHQRLTVDGQSVEVGAVSMGNPHAVISVGDVASAAVATLGPKIERHPAFPQGANVGFAEIVDREQLRLRVFERGVGETLACGSGACATAVIGILRGELQPGVNVELPGGKLEVEWDGRENPVYMTGPATQVFEGRIEL